MVKYHHWTALHLWEHPCTECRPALAYLAGPMRGTPWWNFPAFHAAAKVLRAKGWTIFSPAEHDEAEGLVPVEDGTVAFPVSKCLEWDFARIAEASCVIVLPGWEKSTGVHWEMSVAYALDKPIYAYPDLEKIDLPLVVTDPVSAAGLDQWKTGYASVKITEADLVQPRADEFAGCDIPQGWPERAWYEQYRGKELLVEPRQEAAVAEEVRVVDPETGGAKGSKLARFDLIPWDVMYELAEHFGRGSAKYEDRNWERGYRWSLSIAALGRHLAAWIAGEDIDEETGGSHLVAVMWHASALRWFQKHEVGTDDRTRTR